MSRTQVYRLQVTRSVEADVFYRYGHYVYANEGDRRDANHSFSFALRYSPKTWLSASVTTFLATNSSTRSEFNYDVANFGLALQFATRF